MAPAAVFEILALSVLGSEFDLSAHVTSSIMSPFDTP